MAFSALFLENLAELKSRRGNSTDTTIAAVLGLNYPAEDALVFYRWFNLSTDTADDYEVVQPTVGGIPTGRWFKIDMELTFTLICAALGYIPYDNTNPEGYISNFTEADPSVPEYAKALTAFSVIKASTDLLYEPIITKATAFNKNFGTTSGTVAEGNDTRIVNGQAAFAALPNYILSSTAASTYQPIGSYITTETDPVWSSEKVNYFTKTASDARYLQSFTETDPTVSTYAKSLTSFSVIKTSTDPLYRPITYVPAFADLTSKPTTVSGYGITDAVVIGRSLTINGTTQDLSLNRTWNVGDILSSGSYSNPSWITTLAFSKITGVPIADYYNTANTAGGSGNVVFYLTSDKTSTGTALYTNINYVNPIVNDASTNYTFGWTYNSGTKALTVNVKAAVGINVALLSLTLLGVPSNVADGKTVSVLVKGT